MKDPLKNNINNTWKETSHLISWKQSATPNIHLLSQDNEIVTILGKLPTFLMITSLQEQKTIKQNQIFK